MNKQKEPIPLKRDQIEELVEGFETRLQEVTEENDQLRTKLAQTRHWLLDSQERERTELARALHGGPIQELSSLLFEINTLERMLDDEACTTIVTGIRDNLKASIRSLRKFINTLNPPALAHFGLQAAARSYVEQLQSEHPHLNIALFLKSEERIPNIQVEWALYRVLHEVAQNAVEHAQSRNLMIRLLANEQTARLEVEDDGVGFQLPFEEESFLAQNRMGLFNARMYIERCGGVLEIRTAPGQGATVRAEVTY